MYKNIMYKEIERERRRRAAGREVKKGREEGRYFMNKII
jgi:hypothetical protein